MYDSGIVFRQNGSSVLDVHVYIAMTYISTGFTHKTAISTFDVSIFCPLKKSYKMP